MESMLLYRFVEMMLVERINIWQINGIDEMDMFWRNGIIIYLMEINGIVYKICETWLINIWNNTQNQCKN